MADNLFPGTPLPDGNTLFPGIPMEPTVEDDSFSFVEMLGNVPSSAGKAVGDTYQAFAHPIETAKAIGSLGLGAAQKLIPGEQSSEHYADAFGQAMVDRYGSGANFLKTVEEDPVGVVLDASSILTLGGGAVRGVTKTGSMANKVARSVQNAGMAIDPVNAAVNVGKPVVSALTHTRVPEKLYESAAKFGTTISNRSDIAKTALEYGFMPTAKGVDRLNDVINILETKLGAMISEAGTTNKIPRSRVFRYLREVKKDVGGPKIEGRRDLRLVKLYQKNFIKHMNDTGRKSFTVEELQKFKIDAYDKIKWKPGKTANEAKEKAYKAMARAAKEDIEKTVPEVKDINAKLGPLYEAQKPLTQSAGRIENLNLIPFTRSATTLTGGVLGGVPGAVAAYILALADTPRAKARAAIYLNKLKKQGLLDMFTDNNPYITSARQGLLLSGRTQEEE